ncbi:hypothetical protein [Kitasatospora sp. NPDC017646]|uniref:hypothetical protein n=1 Tax=Kitasatospora sp. NPDC017646 TaxID=3364024 RepID=UPI0037B4AC5D
MGTPVLGRSPTCGRGSEAADARAANDWSSTATACLQEVAVALALTGLAGDHGMTCLLDHVIGVGLGG